MKRRRPSSNDPLLPVSTGRHVTADGGAVAGDAAGAGADHRLEARLRSAPGSGAEESEPLHPTDEPGSANGSRNAPPQDEVASGGRPTSEVFDMARSMLGELLVGARTITHEQLAEALLQQSESGERIGTVLVRTGVIDEHDLAQALASQLGLPYADLARRSPDPDAVELLPETVAREHIAVPLSVEDSGLTVAVAEPSDTLRVALAKATGRTVNLVVAAPTDVQHAIDATYRVLGGIEEQVRVFEVTEVLQRPVPTTTHQTFLEASPVVRVVDLLVTQALRDRASDIHLEPTSRRVRVRFRVDGALHDVTELPAEMGPAIASRLKIMAGMDIVERRRPQDGQVTMEVDGSEVDIRVSTVATIWGESCVLRLLDRSRPIVRMNELGMPSDTHQLFLRHIRAPLGMVLCAGPTGCGKTTTLYAALSEIDDPRLNIMTVEDPVEYVFPTMNQIQTNEQAGLSFADGLKSILRQDPDVILVGEIRDVETARIAVQSALTGHLVLSTLHATDSASAVHRFLDMGIESFLIASSVVAVVSQRLVRRICPSCRAPFRPAEEELAFYRDCGGAPKEEFWHGEGCNFCAGTGYRGRIGVYEMMRITPEIKRLIVGWATQEELQRMAVSQGMRTLKDEAVRLVDNDSTTISEVVRSIYAL